MNIWSSINTRRSNLSLVFLKAVSSDSVYASLTIRDGRYGLDNHQLQLFQLLGRFRSKANHIDSTLFVSNERICLFVTIICEDFVVDVKEAIEEKPAAEEESRQMKQAVVQSVSMSVATLSRLLSTSHEAALSITSCDTLALSGLLFENCAGQSASSLFIDSSSSVSLATPIASSFSVCSSPRSSVNGDISTVFLPHAASITIDPEDGTDEQFCWSTSVGCQSLSGIVDRLMPTFEYKLNVAEGTTSESTLSITSKKTITVTGLGSARSLMVMQSTAQSFAHLSDGSLSLASLGFTETASQIGVSRQKSFFDVKGGSLRPESVEFIPLSFSGTSSFVKMSGASTLSLKRVSFVSMKNEASGDVVMKSVSIFTAGMTGSHEVFLEGQDVGAVISDDWTIGASFWSDSTNTTNIGPLGYHLYPHTNGAVFMSEGFWDHGKCGQERLPCSSLDFAFSLLTRRPKSAWAQTSLSQLFSNAPRQSLLVVKGSTLTLSSTVTITTPPSAAHTASLIKMEGASTMSVSTGCEFKTISQTESGGGAFLSTNGNNNQILSIASSSFESVSSVGDGGVILAQLGAGSKLTVADTTFKLYSSSGKGGALSIVLSSTGSFAVEAGTSFESCSAIMSGSAVFVEAQSLASAITKTSSAGGHASRMEHSELVRRYSSCAVPG
ncbi:hypothetical protein BLNAU_1994 [Blattamonas nauphoetae]|uniref:Uncharacterized protein n=1 Tax=Blattamonas nauphoetae TaxID=2049346 RepID=A0ABQ9YGT8_9EUKA|nr:hypothetical protein BLNAU_1994 [Blattamonas nauphoetae]